MFLNVSNRNKLGQKLDEREDCQRGITQQKQRKGNDDLLSKANSEPSNSDDSDMQQQYSKAGQSIKMPRKPQLYP